MKDIGIEHRVVYAEDEVELCQRLAIRHSPNLLINGVVKFHRLPTEQELREYFNC